MGRDGQKIDHVTIFDMLLKVNCCLQRQWHWGCAQLAPPHATSLGVNERHHDSFLLFTLWSGLQKFWSFWHFAVSDTRSQCSISQAICWKMPRPQWEQVLLCLSWLLCEAGGSWTS